MSFRLGLTGSIGMGKSTTAQMFRDQGVPVWDADKAVHQLYAAGQPAALAIAAEFPKAMTADGSVDRANLRAMIAADPVVLDRLNTLVHPLVAKDRTRFLEEYAPADIVVLDIPLLYETGADKICDAVLVVSAPPEVQRQRVLARGMTPAEFDLIVARQIPDADKRARADHVIESLTLDDTTLAVRNLIATIRGGLVDA